MQIPVRDTAANLWASVTAYSSGRVLIETDTGVHRIADGGRLYRSLPIAFVGPDIFAIAGLAATALKTANYTASPGDIVPVDATSGAVAVTLPTAPADGTPVIVKRVDASANGITIVRGGSDVFNVAGGSTSLTLTYQFQSVQLIYAATAAIWYVTSVDFGIGMTIKDANFIIQDDGDTTKQAKFQASGITTATTRTYTLPDANTTLVGTDNTKTMTNTRITPRLVSTASSATPTPTGDTADIFAVTALAVNAVFAAPSGTPTSGQPLAIRVKDDGTPRTLGFNAVYRFSSDLAAPTTTVATKTLYMWFIWNATSNTWDCYRILNNF